MKRCNPAQMRRNMEIVEEFKRYGVDFVPIVVKNAAHKKELVAQAVEILTELAVADVQIH